MALPSSFHTESSAIWLCLLCSLLAAQVVCSQPQPAWVARYNGLTNGDDDASAIAVDTHGDVYVTGSSWGGGSFDDYATVKCDSSGNEVWVARYDGPGSSWDGARAIVLDHRENIYVTGSSSGSGTYDDYATVKYDSTGGQVWVARYDGTGHFYDGASAVAVDSSGNVYVTGYSYGTLQTYIDYATVKYDANGNQLWVTRYNYYPWDYWNDDYARAIAVDLSGNVYVTGESCGGDSSYDDYATIKYDTNGNQLWVARYNGAGDYEDRAFAIAADSAGNVYVTGWSYGIGSSWDYATIKYDTNGNQIWATRYDGPENYEDGANAIVLDRQGNVYVTGYSYGQATSADYATVKYGQNGNQVWVARYNGPGNGWDYATSIAVDTCGNVYVAGYSCGGASDYDYATVKYDSGGNEVWVVRYDGPGGGYDYGTGIALDPVGNVYVTGTSWGAGSYEDYATIKYHQPVGISQADTSDQGEKALRGRFSISQCSPNPFKESTTISFRLPRAGYVQLVIYDNLGRKVKALLDGEKPRGSHEVTFNAQGLASGVYLLCLEAGGVRETRRLVVLK